MDTKKPLYWASCKCRKDDKYTSQQISPKGRIECLECGKDWPQGKADKLKVISYNQDRAKMSELKNNSWVLYLAESSAEAPNPSYFTSISSAPNVFGIPCRPKGGRGKDTEWDGNTAALKEARPLINAAFKEIEGGDLSDYDTLAIPEEFGRLSSLSGKPKEYLEERLARFISKMEK